MKTQDFISFLWKKNESPHFLFLKETLFLLIPFVFFLKSNLLYGACGAIDRTWDAGAGNVRWDSRNNWSSNNEPDTSSENAIIVGESHFTRMNRDRTIGCLEIQSGRLDSASNSRTITITGDYFRNLTQGSLTIGSGDNHTFDMAGTADQTFENYDPIQNLTISNLSSTVTLPYPFHVMGNLSLTGTSTVVKVNADLYLENSSSPLTIPSGVTLEVNNGATLVASGGIVVNGILKLSAGSVIKIGNSQILDVNPGAIIQLNGSSGNVVTLDSTGTGESFSFPMDGQMSATYFKISRMDSSGLNATSGTIQSLENGEFHNIPANGYALSVGASASLPSTMDSVGFFNDDAQSNARNFNVNASYSENSVSLDLWSGDIGGSSFETDPTGVIDWGGESGTKLILQDYTASGSPLSSINQSVSDEYFGTFAFSLSGNDIATDITSVKLTMTGTATASDLEPIQIFRDAGAGTNCVYDPGTDIQVGSDLILTGSPPSVTVNFSSGDLSPNDTSIRCFHYVTGTSATASDGSTIKFSISATSDVINSQGYDFSESSGPPVSGGTSTILGASVSEWRGRNSTSWDSNRNWFGPEPNSTTDCDVGSGDRRAVLDKNPGSCESATLLSGGEIDWNSSSNVLRVYGNLDVQSSYTFSNATSGEIAMFGTNNQSMVVSTPFPGNFRINNTGGLNNNIVTVTGNSTINGNLIIQEGVLKINDGTILTVLGNITVESGGTLDIEPGGILKLGNARTLTVDLGGVLSMVGTSSKTSSMTSDSNSSGYRVIVNGEIQAQYYTFDHLGYSGGLVGVQISSGASIHSTYHLQNGSFSYPLLNGVTLLDLDVAIPPGNGSETLDQMTFNSSGAPVTLSMITNIDTTSIGSSSTLTLNSYTGDLADASFDNDGSYGLAWTGATNTIDVTQEAIGPSTVDAGSTYTMGRYGFIQTQAGASFSDADVTQMKLYLAGTASSSDISAVRLYADSDCDSASGVLIGSGVFSGSPASLTFNFNPGDFTIEADAASPSVTCMYVQYDIALGAVGGATAGVELRSSVDVSTDVGYLVSGSTSIPLSLGNNAVIGASSTTLWTGVVNTDWTNSSNWSAGVPDSNKSCEINNVVNDPQINSGVTAICNHMTIGNGVLTLQSGTSILEIYGNLENTGSIQQNGGTIRMRDSGSSIAQTLETVSPIEIDTSLKTGGGTLSMAGSTSTLNQFVLGGATSFEFIVPSNHTLILNQGAVLSGGTFTLNQAATIEIPDAQGITVNGGVFQVLGINDIYGGSGQNLGTKGRITHSGSGRWFFSATAGTVSLTGFLFEYLNSDGLNLSGTANLSALDGGQFSYLDPTSETRAIQLNTSASISETTPSNIGWNWGASNTTCSAPCTPSSSSSYYLVYAPNCGGQTLTFSGWFGSFTTGSAGGDEVITESKIYDLDDSGPNCQVSISAANSPVSLSYLSAIAYQSAVSVEWRTTLETDHIGFNVYRSTQPHSGFVQVNSHMIRNFQNSGNGSGYYQFLDNYVENSTLYYYYIEDIALTGATAFHGPMQAKPLASLESAPSPGSDSNTGSTDEENHPVPSIGEIENSGKVDLGSGVYLLSQTQDSFRIEILPLATQFINSEWNGSYQEVSIPGYAKMTDSGYPELLERSVLVEVGKSFSSIYPEVVVESFSSLGNHLIVPAPSWIPNESGVLVPHYEVNSSAYSEGNFDPDHSFYVHPEVKEIGGKYYVQIDIFPLRFKALTGDLDHLDRLVLDVGLDGVAWSQPEAASLGVSPSVINGNLRITFSETGVYEITFDELIELGLNGPFEGVNIDELRLYFWGEEVPLQVFSSDSVFSSGDRLRFFTHYYPTADSSTNEIVLSPDAIYGETTASLRMEEFSGDPAGLPVSDEYGTYAKKEIEKNLIEVFDENMGGDEDHYYWTQLFLPQGVGAPYPSYSYLDIPVDLPTLLPQAPYDVSVKVHLKGKGVLAQNPKHQVGIAVNQLDSIIGTRVFQSQSPDIVEFKVPSSVFISGNNTIRLQVLAGEVPSGDYDLVYINKVEIHYSSSREAIHGISQVFNYRNSVQLRVTNFDSPSISVYDVSSKTAFLNHLDIQLSSDEETYEVRFAAIPDMNFDYAYRFYIVEDSAVLKPKAMKIANREGPILHQSGHEVDFLIIGKSDLLNEVQPLVDIRENEGLRVMTADLNQVYAEYSDGMVSSHAMHEFLNDTRLTWAIPPKYVLILGDATSDPLNFLGNGVGGRMPMALRTGIYGDFGSDHWLGTNSDDDITPFVSIGRIPTNDPQVLKKYIDKVIAYERGERSPQSVNAKHLFFISDEDQMGEGFERQNERLAEGLLSFQSHFNIDQIKRSLSGSHSEAKSMIRSSFENEPVVINYLGHGAENAWADIQVFENSDVSALTHEGLPLVVALNCLNSHFYYPDESRKSLGESLIFHQQGGAIAFWGSTAYTSPVSQAALAQAFYNRLGEETAQTYHSVRIGDLTLFAKSSLSHIASHQDAIESWTLLGDPTLRIPENAFAEPKSVSQSDEDHSSGGLAGCGSIQINGGGSSGGGMELFTLSAFLLFAWAYMRKRRYLGFDF